MNRRHLLKSICLVGALPLLSMTSRSVPTTRKESEPDLMIHVDIDDQRDPIKEWTRSSEADDFCRSYGVTRCVGFRAYRRAREIEFSYHVDRLTPVALGSGGLLHCTTRCSVTKPMIIEPPAFLWLYAEQVTT